MVKTYVLDANALLALLQDTSNADKVDELLRQAMQIRAQVSMSAVNYGEVYSTILREHGTTQAITTMNAASPLPISIVDVTRQRAMQAADVKFKYKLHYADSFAVALAIEFKATLVTSDSDFRRLGHSFAVLWLKA